MARQHREEEGAYHDRPVLAKTWKNKIWFINGDLVRVKHIHRSANMIYWWNINRDCRGSMLYSEFKKKRKKAYTVRESSKLLNLHSKSLPRLVKQGKFPEAIGSAPGGETGWQIRSYYSEDHIYAMREVLSETHHGPPRKDGLITNNSCPTLEELRYRMGDGMLLYTKADDGRFIPIFNETI